MMEAMIVLMCQQTPVAEAAQMIAVHDTQFWRVLNLPRETGAGHPERQSHRFQPSHRPNTRRSLPKAPPNALTACGR